VADKEEVQEAAETAAVAAAEAAWPQTRAILRVIFIILAVMANTMAMTARERLVEYATLKAIGFGPKFVAALIFGESLAIAGIGCAIGIALTFPVGHWFASLVGTLFPVFEISNQTVALQIVCALVVGAIAAALPARRAARVRIVEGLRAIG
jgi:putative ABC transport system permease protein